MSGIDFTMGFGPSGTPRDPAQPTRILVLGDFSGRAGREPASPLGGRKPRRIDLDNFESVFAELKPRLLLDVGSELTVEITPSDPDELHPDELYDRLEPFAELRGLRKRLADPSTFAAAAAELRAAAGSGSGSDSGSGETGSTNDSSTTSNGGNSIERDSSQDADASGSESGGDFAALLGGAVGKGTTKAKSSDRIEAWLEQLVGPHIVPEADPTQDLYLTAVDDSLGQLMRAVLHHPQFKAFEAAWIGLRHLIMEVTGQEETSVFILDSTRPEVAADLGVDASDWSAEASSLVKLLVHSTAGDASWSWVLFDPPIEATTQDLQMAGRLGTIAAEAGADLVGTAGASLFGRSHYDESVDDSWSVGQTDGEVAELWNALRNSPAAEYICLLAPRIVGRQPYGAGSDPIERFQFEEIPAPYEHGRYLWLNPAYAFVALVHGALVSNELPVSGPVGNRTRPLADITLESLPVHTFPTDDGKAMKACAESFLTEKVVEALSDQGIAALASIRNTDRARIWRGRSIKM